MDRSKAFLVLGTAVVLCGFVFLALFSTSSAEKRAPDRDEAQFGKTGRRSATDGASRIHDPASQCRPRRGDQNNEQLSPDDILATSRRPQKDNQQQPESAAAQRVCAEPSASHQ